MATDGLERTLIVADVKWHRCFGLGEDCLVEWLLVDAGVGAEGTQLRGADMDLELAVALGAMEPIGVLISSLFRTWCP